MEKSDSIKNSSLEKYNGIKIVIDGPDLSGKGTACEAIKFFLKKQNLKIFDVDEYCNVNHFFPQFDDPNLKFYVDPDSFDVLLTSEPTHAGIGFSIRNEITYNNSRKYSAKFTGEIYALDRFIINKRFVIPALKKGKIVISQRSEVSSIIYQPTQADNNKNKFTEQDVISIPGNNFAIHKSTPNLILITTSDPEYLIKRLKQRTEKQDNSIFENFDYFKTSIQRYNSQILDNIYCPLGTKIKRLDTSVSIEDTKQKAVNGFLNFMKENHSNFLNKDWINLRS